MTGHPWRPGGPAGGAVSPLEACEEKQQYLDHNCNICETNDIPCRNPSELLWEAGAAEIDFTGDQEIN